MLRHTAHPTESRYEILGLFTVSMIAASLLIVAIGTLLPYISNAFPQERSHISLLVTAFFVGSTLLTAMSGAATDRFGDKAVLIVCGIVMGGALIACAAYSSFVSLVAGLFVYGIGYAAINPVGSHAILFFFKPEERGLAMGVRQMGVPLGGVAGAIVISTAAEYYGYRGALFVTGLIVLVVTLGAAALYREPPQLYGQPVRAGVLFEDMLHLAREPRLLLITITAMILFAVQVALMAFFPWTLVNEVHVSAGFAALVFVIAQFAAAAGRLAWGWISDRVFHGGRVLPLAITCVLCALAALAVAGLRGMPLPALAGVAVLLGAAAEGWFGLAIVAMAEVGGEQHAGNALGFGLSWVMAMAIAAPLAFQWIMQNFGIPAAWHALAVLSIAGVIPAAAAIALERAHSKRASAQGAREPV
jgi:MFS family permease